MNELKELMILTKVSKVHYPFENVSSYEFTDDLFIVYFENGSYTQFIKQNIVCVSFIVKEEESDD